MDVERADARITELQHRLVDLGLEAESADAYVSLLRLGPSKATQLSRALRVNRTDVYRRMQRMAQEGLVRATLSRPAMYQAVPPAEMLEHLEARLHLQRERLQEARQTLQPALDRLLAPVAAGVPRETFRIIQGQRPVQEATARLVEEARVEVRILGRPFPAALRRLQSGVTCRVLLPAHLGAPRPPRRAGLDVRRLDLDAPVGCVIADGERMVQGMAVGAGVAAQDLTAVWTDAPGLVAAQHLLFERLWPEAGKPSG